MLDLVTLSVIVTLVFATLHEAGEPGPLRPDRIVSGVAAAATLWLFVYGLDLVLFPTTNMTSYVLSRMAPVAAFTATAWTIFVAVVRGLDFHLLATWVGAFVTHLAIVTVWGFAQEWWRGRRATANDSS